MLFRHDGHGEAPKKNFGLSRTVGAKSTQKVVLEYPIWAVCWHHNVQGRNSFYGSVIFTKLQRYVSCVVWVVNCEPWQIDCYWGKRNVYGDEPSKTPLHWLAQIVRGGWGLIDGRDRPYAREFGHVGQNVCKMLLGR